jgi:hypothetical protein
MENIAVNKVMELSPPARAVIEHILGRALRDDEQVSVMAFAAHPAPSGTGRAASAQQLREAMDALAERASAVDPQELEEAFQEAMDHVRPRPA